MTGSRSRKTLRCAVYTRKSTEEGLDQDFNSLDAQREACAAYVQSQKHEGWSLLTELYDDGGFSGGSMERPALRRLLADVGAGRIDVVVVYKVDRLTRSLADFARIVAIFDARDVSFVSVTQAFNTTTSMGRLTLNVLLSFAQFEREVTAERIRDKIAASKKKGMWMGGGVPLGYRAENRKLIVDQGEAKLVRRIFERYLALGSVRELKAELEAEGVRPPRRPTGPTGPTGREAGRAKFARGKLYAMLSNPIYAGRVRHKGQTYPGQHDAIIEEELWSAVQDKLAGSRRRSKSISAARSPSPLAGRIFDPDGNRMTPSHVRKPNGKRYRYYVSAPLIEDSVATGARGWRIPADEVEGAVARVVARHLRDPACANQLITGYEHSSGDAPALLARLAEVAAALEQPGSTEGRAHLRRIVTRVDLAEGELRAEASLDNLDDGATKGAQDNRHHEPIFTVRAPIKLQRRGVEMRLVLEGASAPSSQADPMLVKTIVRAQARTARYTDPEATLSISDLARIENMDVADVSRSMQLAWLSPDIVEQILDGTQAAHLTAERLRRISDLPLDWDEQWRLLA